MRDRNYLAIRNSALSPALRGGEGRGEGANRHVAKQLLGIEYRTEWFVLF